MAEDIGVDEGWEEGPHFEPGWPDIQPLGLIVARTASAPQAEVGDEDQPEEDVVGWVIHLGVAPTIPRLALLGDLTIHGAGGFVGVTVVMPFCVRDLDETDLPPEARKGLLKQYGGWASSLMYDHAAMAARSMLAGNGVAVTVPHGTPEVELHLDDDDADDVSVAHGDV